MRQTTVFLALLAITIFSGCGSVTNPFVPPPAPPTTALYVWCAPVADTKIDADYPDQNFSTSGDNTFARAHIPGIVAWYVKSYVKFQLPHFPAGTKVDEAYFEMYHSGTTEDGTTDNTRFNVSPVGRQWSADTITWNNGPDMRGVTSGVNPWKVILHSNDWCGTTNIADTISSWLIDTTKNTGFRIEIGDQQNFYKSFYSNNSFIGSRNSGGRTDSTLGKAPRIIMKVELPAGTSTSDITFGSIEPDTDIKFGAFTMSKGYILMANWITASDWPAAWGVKKGL
jgi:hypothetical protein